MGTRTLASAAMVAVVLTATGCGADSEGRTSVTPEAGSTVASPQRATPSTAPSTTVVPTTTLRPAVPSTGAAPTTPTASTAPSTAAEPSPPSAGDQRIGVSETVTIIVSDPED